VSLCSEAALCVPVVQCFVEFGAYDEQIMPADLRAAHGAIDQYVDSLYRPHAFAGESERVAFLLDLHQRREAELLNRVDGRRHAR
jgi:hypothetical protein